MGKVIGSDGVPLNASYTLDAIRDLSGLILESRGGNGRNSDYGRALSLILERLAHIDLGSLYVYVVSKRLLDAYGDMDQLAIRVHDHHPIVIAGQSPNELQKQIGRAQVALKEPNTAGKGGNPTKRILLHHPCIDLQTWQQIATTHVWANPAAGPVESDTQGTAPTESLLPKLEPRTVMVHQRSSSVIQHVLAAANGICEACSKPAPFDREDGTPYLEVHHVLPLAQGGSDRACNAVAVCPNCHRKFHHGIDSNALINQTLVKVDRLIDERE